MVNELARLLLAEVDKKSKEIAKLHKALQNLASAEILDSPRKVKEACKLLEQSNPKDFGLHIDIVCPQPQRTDKGPAKYLPIKLTETRHRPCERTPSRRARPSKGSGSVLCRNSIWTPIPLAEMSSLP